MYGNLGFYLRLTSEATSDPESPTPIIMRILNEVERNTFEMNKFKVSVEETSFSILLVLDSKEEMLFSGGKIFF